MLIYILEIVDTFFEVGVFEAKNDRTERVLVFYTIDPNFVVRYLFLCGVK